MDLRDTSTKIDRVSYIGSGSYSLSDEQHLKMEVSLGGEEILDAVCPAGKSWRVSIEVHVVETDL
jgi:hypothetical protein